MASQYPVGEIREIAPNLLDEIIVEQRLDVPRDHDRSDRNYFFTGWWTSIGARYEGGKHHNIVNPDMVELARARRLEPDCISATYYLGELAAMAA